MTTNFPFMDSSERAKTVDADGARAQIGVEKYPWRTLPVDKSFFIDTNISPVKLQTMQSAASRWSKKLNRKFRVIKWDNGIEVARLPDVVEQPKEAELTKPDEVASVDKETKFW